MHGYNVNPEQGRPRSRAEWTKKWRSIFTILAPIPISRYHLTSKRVGAFPVCVLATSASMHDNHRTFQTCLFIEQLPGPHPS
eukprot:4080197-Amphidinium_carterae.1